MTGEKDLRTLLGSLQPQLDDRLFVFASTEVKGEAVGFDYLMSFREAEGATFILEKEEAEAAGMEFEFPCRLITLRAHSSLEAVGLMATVASRLAAASISVNPVSAFYHDHLFVPVDKADEAMGVLAILAAENQ